MTFIFLNNPNKLNTQTLYRKLKLILSACALLLLLNYGLSSKDFLDTHKGRSVTFDALIELFKENYWQRNYRDWDTWALDYRDIALAAEDRTDFEYIMTQMFDNLDDEHSSWLGRIDFLYGDLDSTFSPAKLGLGFKHSYIEGKGVLVQRVYPNTPAYKVGLQRGDIIRALNGQDITQASITIGNIFKEAVSKGEVVVNVKRKLDILTFTITPEPIFFETVSNLPQAEMLDATTGYLYVPTFNEVNVAAQAHKLVADLQAQGATSLIVDLRHNLGGRLAELGLFLGMFTQGVWAQAIGRDEVAWHTDYLLEKDVGRSLLRTPDGELISESLVEEPVVFTGPLVVLVTNDNSSAGEVAPLVLQNLGRATIIGQPTNGNVEALRGFDLPDGSVVLMAVANIQSVNGESFDGGLKPDIVASSDLEELARGYDAPVAEALRVLKSLPFAPGKLF